MAIASILCACGGGSDSSTGNNVSENDAPTISISASNTDIRPGTQVDFSIITSDDNMVTEVTCDFDGDGNFENDITGNQQYSYMYSTTGAFSVSCQATDNDNLLSISNSIAILVGYQPGDIVKTIPYPANISGISDIFYDDSSNSLLVFAYDVLSNWQVTKIIQINASSGDVTNSTSISNPDFFMNHASEFTKGGNFYYGTSYGLSNGVPQSLIYKIDLSGIIVSTFPCPLGGLGGYCEGITWDGQFLWSGSSDSKNLSQFATDGSIQITLSNVWDSIAIKDLSYDKATNQLIVNKDSTYPRSLFRIDPSSGVIINSVPLNISEKGDWDGQLWWSINSQNQLIEGIYVGN